MQRKKKILSYAMAVMMLLGVPGCGGEEKEVRDETITLQEEKEETEDLQPSDETWTVYVCGEVKKEGVVILPAGSRVYQAIELAGGMTEEAASSWLNLAEVLTDGARVYVPGSEEVEEHALLTGEGAGMDASVSGQSDGKVNLNQASKEELMTLSGIGESRAEAIIQYREENGGFASIEEIKNISGIKDGIYEKIKEKITV